MRAGPTALPTRRGRGAHRQVRRSRSRPGLSAIAAVFVTALVATSALPAFAVDVMEGEPPPISASALGVQTLSVSGTARLTPAAVEQWLLTRPTAAWIAPVTGELRDGFGPRPFPPVGGASGLHRGQDLGAACGQRVRAASDGVVLQSGWFGTYGNWVLIDHGAGITTGYAHNTSLAVQVGDRVASGQTIALAGNTGASSGCHLHLEVRIGTTAIDPVPFLRARGVRLG